MRSDRAVPLHAANPAEGFAKDICLVAQLRVVRNMLVMAAAATPVMRARSRNTLRRGFQHAFKTPSDEFLLPRGRRNTHKFTGKNQRHEHRPAFVVRQSVTAIHELFNLNFHLESLSVAGGAMLGRMRQVR